MANTCINLYHEILTDPKMGRMSDKLFRRTIELFLIAGKEDNDGILPSVEDIAWTLRTTDKEIQKVIDDLIDLDIVECDGNGYTITHFCDRQNTQLSDAERQAKSRAKKKASRDLSDTCHTNVTEERDACPEKVTLDKDKDKEKNKEKDKEKEQNVTLVTKASQKKSYGSKKNVFLTDEEFAKLHERFLDADQKIENLSLGIASKGYKYKDHYATILNWARRDSEKQTPQKPQETSFGDIRNYFEAVETPQWDIDL